MRLPQRIDTDEHRRAVFLGLKDSGVMEAEMSRRSKQKGVNPDDSKTNEAPPVAEQPASSSTESAAVNPGDSAPIPPPAGSQTYEPGSPEDQGSFRAEDPAPVVETPADPEPVSAEPRAGDVHLPDAAQAESPQVQKDAIAERGRIEREDADKQPASSDTTPVAGIDGTAGFSPSLAGQIPEAKEAVDKSFQNDKALEAAAEAEGDAKDPNEAEVKRFEAGVQLTEEQLRQREMRGY